MRATVSLEQIFGSKIRVRLLKLFLGHPQDAFYVREITRATRSHIHSVRRELSNLCKIGLIHVHDDLKSELPQLGGTKRKFYETNQECVIFNELRALLVKGQLFLQEELARQFSRLGSVKYLALTGFFVDLPGSPTDLLAVGRVSKNNCNKLISQFEEEFGRTINYTVLPLKEFVERKEMMDRFLYNFLESKKVVLIDKLPTTARMGI